MDAREIEADLTEVLVTEAEIQAKLAELERLVTDWHGQGPLHLPGQVSASRACGRLALSRQPRSSR